MLLLRLGEGCPLPPLRTTTLHRQERLTELHTQALGGVGGGVKGEEEERGGLSCHTQLATVPPTLVQTGKDKVVELKEPDVRVEEDVPS